MAGNSQRKGAVRKRGKGIGSTGNTAGSGGRVRRSLEGRGPTPKAEDRPYHKAYRDRHPSESPISPSGKSHGRRSPAGENRVRSAERKAPGAEWVIGRNAVLEALQAGLPVRRAYIMEGAERDSRISEILKITADTGLTLLRASRTELDRMTSGAVHQGVAVQLPEFEYAHPADVLDAALASEAPLVVACDSITDPRNLGAIVRSAAAFDAAGILLPERRSAHMTAASWKTSAGAAARIPIALATNLNRVIKQYADAGFVVVGLAGEGGVAVDEIPGVDGPVLLVVGSEGDGLSRLVRENCDVLAAIPISSTVESLNASVAASIALYAIEAARARN